MFWIIFLKSLKTLAVWLSRTANGTHNIKSIYQITTIHDRSCPPFPDYNFNGADQERSVLMKVEPAYSVPHVFHHHQMWMHPSHIVGLYGSEKNFRGDKIIRKNLHPEIIRQSLQHQKTMKVQVCAEHCVSFLQELCKKGKTIMNSPKTSLFWLFFFTGQFIKKPAKFEKENRENMRITDLQDRNNLRNLKEPSGSLMLYPLSEKHQPNRIDLFLKAKKSKLIAFWAQVLWPHISLKFPQWVYHTWFKKLIIKM